MWDMSADDLTKCSWLWHHLHHADLCCDHLQELTELKNKMEGMAAKGQGRGQGPAACPATSGPLVHSDRSNEPSSPATPPDEPKGRRNAPTRLSRVLAPLSQAYMHQVGSQQLLDRMAMI